MTETELTHCVLIGMGSGVTAPLGLLSHFTANRPDVWTSFIFVSRNLEMIGESLVVLRQICKQRMPRGGIVLYWTAKDEFPDVRLLNAIRLYLETGEESERETLNKAFAEWLRLARLFFGRKRVADLLETEEGETLMYNWTAASLNCLIALLKNSILHESFRNPLKNCILQQGRPCCHARSRNAQDALSRTRGRGPYCWSLLELVGACLELISACWSLQAKRLQAY